MITFFFSGTDMITVISYVSVPNILILQGFKLFSLSTNLQV